MEKSNQVRQDNTNLSIYDSVREVPKEAKKEIEAGRLKGKHDINPMWRIKKLTEVFGPAGFGWYTEIVRTWTEASESGEMAVFVDIGRQECFSFDSAKVRPSSEKVKSLQVLQKIRPQHPT